MFATIIGKKHFDVLLVVYNFANAGKIDQSIADTAKAGIGVVAMKVMAGGQQGQGRESQVDPRARRRHARGVEVLAQEPQHHTAPSRA